MFTNKICHFVAFVLVMGCSLVGCSSQSKPALRVAASPTPHSEILELIIPDLKAEGYDMAIIVSDDYNMPNRALANGELDANFFQHLPYLEEQMKQFGYPLESIATIELEPMGIYSKKIRALSDLKDGASIAVPNDPTNEARALLLLQSEGLIKLKQGHTLQATIVDIRDNPKNLKFIEIDAAMLPRTLEDVDAAAINTNYALGADLSPHKDALVLEKEDSPYANILVIKKGEENRPEIVALKKALTSEKVRTYILERYHGNVIPTF